MSADYWPNFGYANRNFAGADEWDVPTFSDYLFSPSDYKYFERRYAGADTDGLSDGPDDGQSEGCDLDSADSYESMDFEAFQPPLNSTFREDRDNYEGFQPPLNSTFREPTARDIPEVVIPTQFRFPESRPFNYWEAAVPAALRPTREEYYRRVVPPELRSPEPDRQLYIYPGTSNELQNASSDEEEQSGGYMNRLRNFAANQAQQWKNLYGRFF